MLNICSIRAIALNLNPLHLINGNADGGTREEGLPDFLPRQYKHSVLTASFICEYNQDELLIISGSCSLRPKTLSHSDQRVMHHNRL